MPDIYESFTEQETTSAILDDNRITNFAYDNTAFNDTNVPANVLGQSYYDYNAHNNISQTTGLSTSTQTLGFGGSSGVFKRTFMNHYLGRISYNLNKAVQALRAVLGSFREDYSENISEYSEYAGYNIGDVCYRLDGNTITFYRCKSKVTEPAGAFNGLYWEKPEEVLSYDRPAVGVPVVWFEKVPDWAIRFDDGAHYTWEQCPALNFSDFRALVTVDADDTGFTVPDFRGKVPMFTGEANAVKSGYRGDNYTASVQAHGHTSPALTLTLPATSISHTHTGATCTYSGDHTHNISQRCDYDGKNNTLKTRIPVDDVSHYNPATLTNYGGSHGHTGTTTSSGVAAHTHTVTVTGYTGAVKETTGGNPDSFQHCWIVRYK